MWAFPNQTVLDLLRSGPTRNCDTFFKSIEGFCLVPLNMSLCSTPGAIEGNKVTYMNYAHDLIKGGPPNPPAWHDDLGESVRVPSDQKPPDIGPKFP